MFSISNTTKKKPTLPRAKLFNIKKKILGQKYELSLVICGEKMAKSINTRYRHKEYTPNVLSFPISKDEGEIFICMEKIKKESYLYEMTPAKYLIFIFIHSCLHLKGHTHGSIMEKEEERLFEQFT